MKELLIEDIQRISSIMEYNNMKVNTSNIIVESLLLTEGPIERELVVKLKSLLSKPAVKDAVERVVGTDANKTIDVLLDEYIARAIRAGGAQEKALLKVLIKDITEVNQDFAKIVAQKFYPQFETLIKYYERNNSANPYIDALSTFERNYGKNVKDFVEATYKKSNKIKTNVLTKVDYSKVTDDKGLTLFRKFMNSPKNIVGLRREVLRGLDVILANINGAKEKLVEDIYSDLSTILANAKAGGGLEGGFETNISLFRDVHSKIRALQKNNIDWTEVYSNIRSVLIEKGGYSSKDANLVIDSLKKYDPFSPENSGSWLLEMLGSTTYQKFYNEMFNSKQFTKDGKGYDMIQKAGIALIRGIMFTTTGSIKRPGEILEFINEKGYSKGIGNYLLFMEGVHTLGLPTFFTTMGMLGSSIKGLVSGYQNTTWWNEMKEIAKEEYTKPYKNEEGEYTLMGIIPWESYWSELIDIMNSDINGDLHKKLKETLVKWKNIGNEELDRVKKEFDEYKKQMEKKAKETVAPIVDEIANTEPGFKAFCLKNKYTFDGFGGNSGRTIEKNSLGTNDWYWDTSSNTFKPY